MTDHRLVPTKYRVRGFPSRLPGPTEGVSIEERRQMDGRVMWAVTDSGVVLNRSGEWEYEPIPSSRDEDFLARTRYASVEEALATLDASLAHQIR